MPRLSVAMDLGTSGLRDQALDVGNKEIISTVITTRHPLPGANVIDHLHLAIEMGVEVSAGRLDPSNETNPTAEFPTRT